MNCKAIDEKLFMKNDNPQVNDLFIVVRKNNHQTPYLIIRNEGNNVALVNLHSGQMNYSSDNIDILINYYLEENKDRDLIPITGYFFVKGYKTNLSIQETFGYIALNS